MRANTSLPKMLQCLAALSTISVLITLSSSAPVAPANSTGIEPLTVISARTTSLIVENDESTIADSLALRPESPLIRRNRSVVKRASTGGQQPPTGPPGGQNQATAGFNAAQLQPYEATGRGFYLQLVLRDYHSAALLLDQQRGCSTQNEWQSRLHLPVHINNGWSESDQSAALSASRYMERFTTAFSQMTVGAVDSTIAMPQHLNQVLRNPNRAVWPQGPNRLLRMVRDKPWAPEIIRNDRKNSQAATKAKQKRPTGGYYDVIHNPRDGLMILLRQLPPLEAVRQGSPPPRPPLRGGIQGPPHGPVAAQTFAREEEKFIREAWEPSELWYAEWWWQHTNCDSNRDTRAYELMVPRYHQRGIAKKQKQRDLNFIIIPDVGQRGEQPEGVILGIISACLKSTRHLDLANLPPYGTIGSCFPTGTWCANALLATAPSSDVALFLARHRKESRQGPDFNGKTIAGVHIVKLDQGIHNQVSPTPTLMWQIAESKQQDGECAQAWGKTPIGQPLPLVFNPQGSSYTDSGKGKAPAVNVPEKCYPPVMKALKPPSPGQTASTGQPVSSKDDDVEMGEAGDESSEEESSDESSDAGDSAEEAAAALMNVQGGRPAPNPQGRPGPAPIPQWQPPPARHPGPGIQGQAQGSTSGSQRQVASAPQAGQHANDPLRNIGVLDNPRSQGQSKGRPRGG